MKIKLSAVILSFFVSLFVFQTALAQTPTQTPTVKEANPADVSSIDAIMKAVYEVISGDAGQKRDWDRFRTLFHPSARLIPTGKNPNTGVTGARAFTAEEYITRSAPFMEKEGFFEKEIARRADVYGNIAQIFSTYASYHKLDDKEPFMRGINSFQLLFDGKRWWVVTIYWQGETKEVPIPKKYLKSKK
ncbi:MAG: hypothetical protein ABWZ66_13350 [Pyrinomonadaceae bacterium]